MGKETWAQKMDDGREPVVEVIAKDGLGFKAGSRMLISTPREMAAEIASLPRGTVMTVPDLRSRLAAKHGADGTCPLTTGIFLRIITEAAYDDLREGKSPGEVTPFWRVEPTKKLLEKLSFDAGEYQRLAALDRG